MKFYYNQELNKFNKLFKINKLFNSNNQDNKKQGR